MQITAIRIRKVPVDGKLLGYVTVTFDDCFVVHNVKIIEGKEGLFIAMPSRKTSSGEYKDVAHPISPEFRQTLQDAILTEYYAGHVDEAMLDVDEHGRDTVSPESEGRDD
ncbi:MAG: septation regulator SpoVG [Spirochaetaceae bacterium]|jgi:stage V sporulation protein G|nr:septation regulator SpoVG [Spirochaetaceae bacterium]